MQVSELLQLLDKLGWDKIAQQVEFCTNNSHALGLVLEDVISKTCKMIPHPDCPIPKKLTAAETLTVALKMKDQLNDEVV